MARPKYPKPDTDQAEIATDLRKLGCVVWITASLPTPVLDLIVCRQGRIVIAEVKPKGRITFTPGEIRSIEELKRVGIEVVITQRAEDVLAAFDALEDELPFTDPLPRPPTEHGRAIRHALDDLLGVQEIAARPGPLSPGDRLALTALADQAVRKLLAVDCLLTDGQ